MVVEVRLFATLRDGRFVREQMDVPSPCRLRDLLRQLDISEREALILLVNGTSAGLDCELAERDVVSLFPAIGGG